jgi:RNA:NAD 2'-phosphotransferase (TPT1/KptA family)
MKNRITKKKKKKKKKRKRMKKKKNTNMTISKNLSSLFGHFAEFGWNAAICYRSLV